VRLAALRTPRGIRVHVRRDGGYVDLAEAVARPELATVDGALAGWPETLEAATAAEGDDRVPIEDADFAPFVPLCGRILCVGHNYAAHVAELARETLEWPEIFARFPSSAVGAHDPVVVTSLSEQVDYEGELGVVIGCRGRHVPASETLGLVAGYTVCNDVSVRDWQLRGSQWTAGKNFDGTLPVGPELVTPDEVDAADLPLETRLNGEVVQSARTSQMLLGVADLLEFLSSFTMLGPGDLIVTGTPGGVGLARDPQRFLREGDVIEVAVDGVGALRNPVRLDNRAPATERWRALARQTLKE
jgi:acylpyruvate hydrolase